MHAIGLQLYIHSGFLFTSRSLSAEGFLTTQQDGNICPAADTRGLHAAITSLLEIVLLLIAQLFSSASVKTLRASMRGALFDFFFKRHHFIHVYGPFYGCSLSEGRGGQSLRISPFPSIRGDPGSTQLPSEYALV